MKQAMVGTDRYEPEVSGAAEITNDCYAVESLAGLGLSAKRHDLFDFAPDKIVYIKKSLEERK